MKIEFIYSWKQIYSPIADIQTHIAWRGFWNNFRWQTTTALESNYNRISNCSRFQGVYFDSTLYSSYFSFTREQKWFRTYCFKKKLALHQRYIFSRMSKQLFTLRFIKSVSTHNCILHDATPILSFHSPVNTTCPQGTSLSNVSECATSMSSYAIPDLWPCSLHKTI